MKCINAEVCQVGTSELPPISRYDKEIRDGWSCDIVMQGAQVNDIKDCPALGIAGYTHIGIVEEVEAKMSSNN